MGRFAPGQVVILPFPFSDLAGRKQRPALLIAEVGRGDWIAAQITSRAYGDDRALPLSDADFAEGGLPRASFVRPGKLFTANDALFQGVAGVVRDDALRRVCAAVYGIIQGEGCQ